MEIGRLTVDLIKEIYKDIKNNKNCDALFDFYLFLPLDLLNIFYRKYIKKENCSVFYTLDNHCFCEMSSHVLSFPKTLMRNFFCNNGKPNNKKISLGVFADYIGCTQEKSKK